MSVTDATSRVQELHEELARLKHEFLEETSRHKQTEEMYKKSLREQRKLTAHIMDIREQERKSVAHEVHENLGQILASLQLNLSLLTLEYNDHAQLISRTGSMEQLIFAALNTVQRISSELRPFMLDQLGLADALEWQLQEFQKNTGISTKAIILLLDKNVNSNVSTAIYRIVQEALANVVLHTSVSHVRVILLERGGRLCLSIYDNGRGITNSEERTKQSFGIDKMNEWSTVIGGKLRVCASQQKGTALFARIPLTIKENKYAD